MNKAIEVEVQAEELYTVCVKPDGIHSKWGPICDNGEGDCMNVYETKERAQEGVHRYQHSDQKAKVMQVYFSEIDEENK